MTLRNPQINPNRTFPGQRHDANAVKRLERNTLALQARVDALEAMLKTMREQAVHSEKVKAKPKRKKPTAKVYDPMDSEPFSGQA